MTAITHYVMTDGALTTRFRVTWPTHAAATRNADTLRTLPGVTCIWIETPEHAAMIDAIADRMAERDVEPCV